MLEEGVIKVSKLTGSSNYELWAIYVKAVFIVKDLFNFGTYATKATTVKALKEDVKVLSYIQLAYIDGPLLYILAIENLANVQDYLNRLYIPYGFSLEFILFKEFFGATLSVLGIVENFLVTIKRVSTNLKVKNLELLDKLVIAQTLYNFSPEYKAFVTSTT